MRLICLVIACAVGLAAPARGQAATVCPAAPGDDRPPDAAAPGCAATPLAEVDPQGRMIWVLMDLAPPAALSGPAQPVGLFVSAKASSEAWLNGARLGANGIPAATRAAEIPGRMDAVLPVPPDAMRPGENRLALRMSSHRGLLRLAQPIHAIGLGPYAPPQYSRLNYYWPSLITFGVLLAGGLYFAAVGLGARRRFVPFLLSAMSLLAAAQLFAEVSRGLFAYAYPAQDLRLILIAAFSVGFGLCLAAYLAARFAGARPRALFGAIAAASLAAVLLVPGYDYKAMLAFLVPAAAGAAACLVWTVRRRPGAAAHLAALSLFTALVAIAPVRFVDTVFYLIVAAFLLFLFVQQAFALSAERRLRAREAARASRIALVLEQRDAEREAAGARTLTVAGAGRVEKLNLADIAWFEAAGDYVEICMLDGRRILHAESMNALEEALPSTFVRVRRSHIVNTAHVRALERDPSGVGRLILSNGAEAPVSRRVLPKVRDALT